MIGSHDKDKFAYSDSITQICAKLLATMPQKRCYHGVAIFGNKILIVGGKEELKTNSLVISVLIYDITKDECLELAPLPYERKQQKWSPKQWSS